MTTVELKFFVADVWHEFLIAELGALDFDVFQQEENLLKAYIAAPGWDEAKRLYIEGWLRSHDLSPSIEAVYIPEQNWNRNWEETIEPLAVGPFLIKPTWAELPPEQADRLVLEIDPKMSFGTGYHESTRLALRFLPDLIRGGEWVLDAGTGTGILAIAAVKLGARAAIAYDIDPWVKQNAMENFHLNGVTSQISFREGTIAVVAEEGFDVILANINRNVLIDLLPTFRHKLQPHGAVVLSGLLNQDRSGMLPVIVRDGLRVVDEASEGSWWSVVLRHA